MSLQLKRVFYALYMGVCAASLIFLSGRLLHVSPSRIKVFALSLSTMTVYLLYWFLADVLANIKKRRQNHLSQKIYFLTCSSLVLFSMSLMLYVGFFQIWLIAVGFLCIVYFSLLTGWLADTHPLVAGFLKTILLATIWSMVTTVIPFLNLSNPVDLEMLFLCRLFFLLPICIVFDIKDEHADRANSRPTLATALSYRPLKSVLFFACFVYVLTVLLSQKYMKSNEGVVDVWVIIPFLLMLFLIVSYRPKKHIYWLAVDALMIYATCVFYISSM